MHPFGLLVTEVKKHLRFDWLHNQNDHTLPNQNTLLTLPTTARNNERLCNLRTKQNQPSTSAILKHQGGAAPAPES
jgi:hypothetical protein